MHLALGGCLKAPPIRYGLTADTGGHIAYVLDAARAQAQLPCVSRVAIVTRRFDDAALGREHGRESEPLDDGVTIDRIGTDETAYLEKEALAAELPALAEALDRHIAALPRQPDVIHAHFADAGAIALVIRARRGIPVVYTPHALGIDKRDAARPDATLDARIGHERRVIAAADAIVVSTHDEAERQLHAYGVADAAARIHRIPPGIPARAADDIDPAGVAAWLGQWLDDPARPIVLAIARPVRKKNLAGLVRAYVATPALHAAANLVILAGQQGGRPSDEERAVLAELHALCATLPRRIALPPRHDQAHVAALYQMAANGGVFANPALHEPFGLTLVEAASAGVPVVATRNGGPREIVGTLGHGLLVDPRDDAAIGTACARLIGDPALHATMAAAGRQAPDHYSWSAYAGRSAALYATLHAPPRLLACDIDATLTGCTAGAAAFADWCATRSMPFVVATGRDFAAARAVMAHWHLPPPDAFIVDVGTRIMLPGDDGGWRECPDYAASLDEAWDRAAIAAVLASLPLVPQSPETAGPHKLSFFGTSGDAALIERTLAGRGLRARVIFSHGKLIDVLAPGGGKAAAIASYARRQGLSLAHCVAAGDSGNDIDMLTACGHAIVVANATSELDDLPGRDGLRRVGGRHAAGVMEGLATLGLVGA